ncbi:MAG: VCBS repeat-containing protein, partial [Planctomycetaceae bacterium]|nr:VCBS repeat-containing protein [Planctomycetaceae bacterium]
MSTNSTRRGRARGASGAAVLALALGLAPASCSKPEPPPPPPKSDYAKVPRTGIAASDSSAPFSSFEDAAEAAGLPFVHENGARGGKYLPETMGSGAAVLDYDGDGRMDLYLVNSVPWPWDRKAGEPLPTGRLFRNRGDGTFEDRTAEAGLADARFGLGACAADYDGDGDADLFVAAVGPCALWRNDGGRFTDVAREAGVAGEPWTDAAGASHDPVCSAGAFLDYDGDSVLDLYVTRYVKWSRENDVFTSLDGRTKAYTVPDRYRGDSGRLYRGRGDGTFEDVTDAAGVREDSAKALGVAACDLDGDRWTDIVIANDTQPNHLFRNRGDGTFEEVGLPAGIAYDAAGKARADMGIAVGRADDNDLPVVVTGTFSQEAVSYYRRQERARSFTFVDEGPAAGIAGPTFPSLTFGVLLLDLDLDGRLDLPIANGHLEPTIQQVMAGIPYAQKPQVFRNLGGGRFEDASARAGPAFGRPCVGRGLAWLDFDGDGDADLVLTTNGGP